MLQSILRQPRPTLTLRWEIKMDVLVSEILMVNQRVLTHIWSMIMFCRLVQFLEKRWLRCLRCLDTLPRQNVDYVLSYSTIYCRISIQTVSGLRRRIGDNLI